MAFEENHLIEQSKEEEDLLDEDNIHIHKINQEKLLNSILGNLELLKRAGVHQ